MEDWRPVGWQQNEGGQEGGGEGHWKELEVRRIDAGPLNYVRGKDRTNGEESGTTLTINIKTFQGGLRGEGKEGTNFR